MAASLCSGIFDNKMTPEELQELLQSYCNQPLYLKLNENRSVMCSIKWETHRTKVSLHRIFLTASKKVIQALGKALKKEGSAIPAVVNMFIHEELKNLNYSEQINPDQLDFCGEVYNIKELYDGINQEYFCGKLDLSITWFSSEFKQNKSQINLGFYYDALRLVKINRIMDSRKFPDYVVRYVIYHEMLHCVAPAYIDSAGIQRTHNPEFKQLEMQFKDYSRAKLWVKKNRASLFELDSRENFPQLKLYDPEQDKEPRHKPLLRSG